MGNENKVNNSYQDLLKRMSVEKPEHTRSEYEEGVASSCSAWSSGEPLECFVDLSKYGAICDGKFSMYHPANIQKFGSNTKMQTDGKNLLVLDSFEIFGNLDENQGYFDHEGIVGNIYFFLEPNGSQNEYSAIRKVVEKPTLRDRGNNWLELMRETAGNRNPIDPTSVGFKHHFSHEEGNEVKLAAWSIIPGGLYDAGSTPKPHEWGKCKNRINQQEFAGFWQRINYTPTSKSLADLDENGFSDANLLSLRIYESDGKSNNGYKFVPLLQVPIIINDKVQKIVIAHDISDEKNVFIGYYNQSGKFLSGDDIIARQNSKELFMAVVKMSIRNK